MAQTEEVLASISICLYSLLALLCGYCGVQFWDFRENKLIEGRYIAPKFQFFVILFVSAMLDIPLYVGCLSKHGAKECMWNDQFYIASQQLHLVATCGYLYAIITPAVLWSDVVHLKDGHFWNSSYPIDSTKLFFRVMFVLFCLNELTSIVGSIIFQRPSDTNAYTDSHSFGEISELISPILLSLITIGCLWSGIRLQRYVINVQLGNSTLIKILMHLNFTMFLIVATYGLRALLVLTLYSGMSSYYKKALEPITDVYISWIITTRWMPSVFCSLCLVNEMKRHGPNSSNSNSNSGSNTQFKSADTSIGDDDSSPLDSMGHKLLHTDDADYHPLLLPVFDRDEKLYPHTSKSDSSFASIFLDTSSSSSILSDTSLLENTINPSSHPHSRSDDSNSVFRISISTLATEGMDFFFSRKALHKNNNRAVSHSSEI